MARFYRLVQARWAQDAMSGEGARLAGGRWNPPGLPAVYLAGSRSLAALEIVVHAPREVLSLDWRIFEVEVPDDAIEEPERLPKHWAALPSSPAARRFGGAWLRESRALALRVPSAIVPQESVLLLNPGHAGIDRIRVSKPEDFRFDSRI
ncbi:RES family NAD+ phosphorylase [Haloferula sp. A504]|uniref:RES family NAD+ phosphorylase n=1 Tax=Haloferula sp. A504 TaxID=3373601 RepID=UPI0031C3A599|nr:RES family NAD+ phosphorylase [Verrucomicrobiaceae bacterium E54]